jgi:hypothetical protein
MRYQRQEVVFDNFEQKPYDSCTPYHCSRHLLVFPQKNISSCKDECMLHNTFTNTPLQQDYVTVHRSTVVSDSFVARVF